VLEFLHGLAGSLLLLPREGLTLLSLDILGESDNGLTGKLLKVLGCDVTGKVANRQTGETEVEGGVLLDESLSLLEALLAHLDLGGRKLLVERGVGGDGTLGQQVETALILVTNQTAGNALFLQRVTTSRVGILVLKN
jgi:hypothetical protein